MPNMNKQWRAELRDLKRNKKKVLRDYDVVWREQNKICVAAERIMGRARKASNKAIDRMAKREAILRGRLS